MFSYRHEEQLLRITKGKGKKKTYTHREIERALVTVGRTALSHFRNKTMNRETHLQITSHRIFTFIFG